MHSDFNTFIPSNNAENDETGYRIYRKRQLTTQGILEIGRISTGRDMLLSIIGNTPYGMLVTNKDGIVIMANSLSLELLGLPQELELKEASVLEVTSAIPEVNKAVQKAISSGNFEFNLPDVPVGNKRLVFRARKVMKGMLIGIQNVTKLKELEQTALNAVIEGQEKERTRLAKEIHDGFGPVLSTIRIHLEGLESEVSKKNSALSGQFNTLRELIDELAEDMRNISHALMPGLLEDFGLVSALSNLAERVSESKKVHVEFIHSGMGKRLDKKIEQNLYRIGQELLNNSLKYSGSSLVTIQLVRHHKGVSLTVEDEGKGFDKKLLKGEGIGFKNIDARTKALGGSFLLETAKGKGTMGTVTIPI